MNEVIGWDMEEWFVAEDRPLDDHGGDRGDDSRAEERRVHVANDFLQREQHRGHRCVECRRQGAGGADRDQISNAFGGKSDPAADGGREAGADLHRRALAPHRMARSDAEHARDELAERNPAGNGTAGLRHAAASRIGKELHQQCPRHQAHERGHREQPETRGRQSEEMAARLFDCERKQDSGQTRQDADDDGQDQKELIFAQPQPL